METNKTYSKRQSMQTSPKVAEDYLQTSDQVHQATAEKEVKYSVMQIDFFCFNYVQVITVHTR